MRRRSILTQLPIGDSPVMKQDRKDPMKRSKLSLIGWSLLLLPTILTAGWGERRSGDRRRTSAGAQRSVAEGTQG